MKQIEIFTDGACKGNPGPGGWGAIIRYGKHEKEIAGGRLWLSPHDETATPACDAAPEELDIALAIDRLQQVVDWDIRRVERKWAGLRSFAPDRLPVIGRDGAHDAFFWFAGQGGFGIQTAPAAAQLAGSLLNDAIIAPDRVNAALYAPGRFN